jgi:hypothetical protein
MLRRLPSALILIAGLLSSVALAAEDPARPSILSATLSGGFAWRQSTQSAVPPQTQATEIDGTSPTVLRLRVDWFPLRWLGVEGEGLGDFFLGVRTDPARKGTKLDAVSARALGRVGVVLRFVTDGGFVLNGSLGYGISAAPIIRYITEAAPDVVRSNGPVARLGGGYQGARFEGLASVTLMMGLATPLRSIEPQVWLAGRVADIGPTALWVGVDASALLEGSPAAIGYDGRSVRIALGIKLALLPPAPPVKKLEAVEGATTLKVKVLLPDGAAAAGAQLSLDGAAPVPLDAQGELVSSLAPGAHTATATLAGHRQATAQAQVVEGQQTELTLPLQLLTGPGKLTGVVRASATAKPVPDATVTAGDGPAAQTGADGSYHFDRLGPGPVKVRVEAQGFAPADEIAQVPPESAATLDVQLDALGKGSPATVRGLVRSRTGEPLKGSVVIKGLATRVQVTPEGRFLVTVPGGEYLFIISAPGYVTQTKKVVLSDGDQAIVHTELQKVTQ